MLEDGSGVLTVEGEGDVVVGPFVGAGGATWDAVVLCAITPPCAETEGEAVLCTVGSWRTATTSGGGAGMDCTFTIAVLR